MDYTRMRLFVFIILIFLIDWSFTKKCTDKHNKCDYEKCMEKTYREECQNTCGACECKDHLHDCGSKDMNCSLSSVLFQCPYTCQLCEKDYCGNIMLCKRSCKLCAKECKDYGTKVLCAGYNGTNQCKKSHYTRNLWESCKDIDDKCDFKLCIKEEYRTKYKETCGVCQCKDYDMDCGSKISDCHNQKIYTQCQQTCGLCGDFCGNKLLNEHCDHFHSNNKCSDDYVKSVCKRSCGECDNICKDYATQILCKGYKGSGKLNTRNFKERNIG
ncbi:unnamed protein product [Lepeophtheirus salmonis]|uniref:(salmon louse) hypothetical protein n=1 Tax=Lepeophtheirus salmonis TaxID=72036 RepID=A0A7R8CN13_LEPSM|nr:unnamed protein product [Lepeophtheirus salmonis]CAF2870347.1 unnamed protein product [Lepeophtheirus salmonis]